MAKRRKTSPTSKTRGKSMQAGIPGTSTGTGEKACKDSISSSQCLRLWTVLAVAAFGIISAIFIMNFDITHTLRLHLKYIRDDLEKKIELYSSGSRIDKSQDSEDFSCRDRQRGSCGKVDKREKLSLEEFSQVYDGKWPVIVTDVMSNWPAMNWTADFFKTKYGRTRVTMTTYGDSVKSGFSVPLEVFLKHVHLSTETTWTYLQDEVFLIQHPELKAHVLDPIYTQGDLFQLLPAAVRPWDCMLLWGTAHSRSALHVDPYNWTGTNAVISGLKRWKLLPPGQDRFLSVKPGMPCGFPLECVKYNSVHDLFDSAQLNRLPDIQYVEVDQGPGEMLFIPPGWFHQAYNAVPTMAISGQLMNSNNYRIVLEEMFKGGSLDRSTLPEDLDLMEPMDAVKAVATQIPRHVLEEGMRRTAEAIRQLYVPPTQP